MLKLGWSNGTMCVCFLFRLILLTKAWPSWVVAVDRWDQKQGCQRYIFRLSVIMLNVARDAVWYAATKRRELYRTLETVNDRGPVETRILTRYWVFSWMNIVLPVLIFYGSWIYGLNLFMSNSLRDHSFYARLERYKLWYPGRLLYVGRSDTVLARIYPGGGVSNREMVR
jgi:hypothetical protein